MCLTHHPPHPASDSRIKRNPVCSIAPCLRDAGHRPGPRTSPVLTAKETDICCGYKTAVRIERVKHVPIVRGYIQSGGCPLSAWQLLRICCVPVGSAVDREHRASEVRPVA